MRYDAYNVLAYALRYFVTVPLLYLQLWQMEEI